MSSCACNRWGPGTTCEKPSQSESANELKQKLAALQIERQKLDTLWSDPPASTPLKSPSTQKTKK